MHSLTIKIIEDDIFLNNFHKYQQQRRIARIGEVLNIEKRFFAGAFVLDLACGSQFNHVESLGGMEENSGIISPWFLRILSDYGAHCIGVDLFAAGAEDALNYGHIQGNLIDLLAHPDNFKMLLEEQLQYSPLALFSLINVNKFIDPREASATLFKMLDPSASRFNLTKKVTTAFALMEDQIKSLAKDLLLTGGILALEGDIFIKQNQQLVYVDNIALPGSF